jgi:hypothetical protein
MATAPVNQAQKFDREMGRLVTQPPPPFPRLPQKFIDRYEPEIQDVLNAYSDACQDWVKKYVTGSQV